MAYEKSREMLAVSLFITWFHSIFKTLQLWVYVNYKQWRKYIFKKMASLRDHVRCASHFFFFREEPIGFGFQRLRLTDFRMCFYSFNGIAVLEFKLIYFLSFEKFFWQYSTWNIDCSTALIKSSELFTITTVSWFFRVFRLILGYILS